MTSSQEVPTSQKQSYLLSTAMTPHQCAFADTVPNMIPRLADTSKENASDCVNFFSKLETKHSLSHPGVSSLGSRPPDNAHTFLDQHLNISPHRQELASSPAVQGNISGLSSNASAVDLAFCRSKPQTASLPVLLQQAQDVPLVEDTMKVASIPSKTAGVKVSRLPSNDMPRKAPLQRNSRSRKSPSQEISRKIPTPKQQRSTSRQETPTRAAASVQKRRQSPNDGHGSIAVQCPIVPHETDGGKKRMENYCDQESKDIERVEKLNKIGEDEGENESDTAKTTSSGKTHSEEWIRVKGPRCKSTKKRRTTQVTPSSQSRYAQRRRPLYEYEVPMELEGIRKALGPDNWNEYVYLMESLWLNKVTAHEFEQGAKSLFRIDHDGMRKRMNSMMVMKMIMPRLEEIRNGLDQQSE